MIRKAVNKTVDKLYKRFSQQCQKFTKDFGKDELHELRVNYKKLRAAARMLMAAKSGERFGFPKKIKQLYHIAGCVRDYQLQYERILKVAPDNKPKTYLQFLKKSIRSFEKKYISIDVKRKLEKTKAELKQLLPSEITANVFELFFNQQWNTVQAIVIQQHFTDNHLHSIRKCIKDIQYNMDIYKSSIATILPSSFPVKNIQLIKSLLNLLGDHQDLHRALELLSPQLVEKFHEQEQKQLTGIRLILMSEKLELKKLAVSKLKKEFTFKEQPL